MNIKQSSVISDGESTEANGRQIMTNHTRRINLKCSQCQSLAGSEWGSLTGADLQLLNDAVVAHSYRPGDVIFYQGSACQGLHCVASGTVALRKADPAGHSMLLRLIGTGETLGYRAFFSDSQYLSTAEALDECCVCFINREAVLTLTARNPEIERAIIHRLSKDLALAEEARLNTAGMSARTRLAHLLLSFRARFGSTSDDGTLVLELPLSRRDLADALGIRAETLARQIRALRDDKVVYFDNRTVKIRDVDSLLDEVSDFNWEEARL